MVHVIASVRLKPGKRDEFLEVFKSNVPIVRKETGCIEYLPAVDIDAGLPPQAMDINTVTIIEKWESLEALSNHLAAPHMLTYRERTKGMVEGLSIKVLQEA
jgi:quinol monooxygenase YgiN